MEDAMRTRMATTVGDVEKVMNKIARLKARSGPIMEMLGGFAIAGFVVYAGHGVLAGGQMPGEFFSVITALLLAYEPAKRLARLHIDLTAALGQARFMFELLDSLPVEHDENAKPPIAIKQGQIEFRDVAFRYRPTEPVLRGVSFVAAPGRTLALVGSSGSGKSTIMNLVVRFWDPQAGKILVDEQDIVQFSRRSLRDSIAYVGQDVFMFSGTIRENIEMGRPGASEAEIFAAAQAAFAHDFILSFPQGYDSPVGEHGVQVSGGQRARIAIARAFLKNAPILLLDEPTSALDSETEREVQRALDALRASRTTLVIAEGLAGQEFHHQERPSLMRVDFEDLAGPRMVDKRGRPRLGEQVSPRVVVEQLQRDVTIEALVARGIDHTQPATAELTQHAVTSDVAEGFG
jgi:ATP-binding cassette subfamily B protein